MNPMQVPTRGPVSSANQARFDPLKTGLGSVPSRCATLARCEDALGNDLRAKTQVPLFFPEAPAM